MKWFMIILFSFIFAVSFALPGRVSAASITETSAAIGEGCTASGNYSTAMGKFTTAGGDYSFSGGRYMQLAASADRTFVWGYSDTAQPLYAANAFLIFPAGVNGNVGIGTTSPDYKLEVNGDAAKIGGGSWSVSSDERLKDITGEYNQGLEAVTNLRPITFQYKSGNPRDLPSNVENVGFVAQEVQETFPEAISEGADGYLDFNMHPVNVAMVNAIKELKAKNDALESENASLKRDIERIIPNNYFHLWLRVPPIFHRFFQARLQGILGALWQPLFRCFRFCKKTGPTCG